MEAYETKSTHRIIWTLSFEEDKDLIIFVSTLIPITLIFCFSIDLKKYHFYEWQKKAHRYFQL